MALLKATEYLANKGGVRDAIIAEEKARAAAKPSEPDLGDALEAISDQLPQFGGMVLLGGVPPRRFRRLLRGGGVAVNRAPVRIAQPALSGAALYRAALRIGRDHISSTVNTLFLAYAGAALPLLLLFTQSGQSFGVVTSQEIVATEIVRSLAGSVGLVAAVPITTWMAVWVLRHPEPVSAMESESL